MMQALSLQDSRNEIRVSNVLLHANGRIYGETDLLGFDRWTRYGSKLLLKCNSSGRQTLWARNGEHWDSPAYPLPHRGAVVRPVRQRAATMRMRAANDTFQLAQQPSLPSKDRFEIVVARYREDISWCDFFLQNVTIYNKGPDFAEHHRLANVGREAHTYLTHVVECYDNLAERTAFLQGHPFDHRPPPISRLAHSTEPFVSGPLGWSVTMGFVPSWSRNIDEHVMRAFLDEVECDSRIGSFSFVFGAQFSLPREVIRRRSRSYYQRLRDFASCREVTLGGRQLNDHAVAFLFEFFWQKIFPIE